MENDNDFIIIKNTLATKYSRKIISYRSRWRWIDWMPEDKVLITSSLFIDITSAWIHSLLDFHGYFQSYRWIKPLNYSFYAYKWMIFKALRWLPLLHWHLNIKSIQMDTIYTLHTPLDSLPAYQWPQKRRKTITHTYHTQNIDITHIVKPPRWLWMPTVG